MQGNQRKSKEIGFSVYGLLGHSQKFFFLLRSSDSSCWLGFRCGLARLKALRGFFVLAAGSRGFALILWLDLHWSNPKSSPISNTVPQLWIGRWPVASCHCCYASLSFVTTTRANNHSCQVQVPWQVRVPWQDQPRIQTRVSSISSPCNMVYAVCHEHFMKHSCSYWIVQSRKKRMDKRFQVSAAPAFGTYRTLLQTKPVY